MKKINQKVLDNMSINEKFEMAKIMAKILVAGCLDGGSEDIRSLSSGFYQRRFKKIAMGDAGVQAMAEFDMEAEEKRLDKIMIRMYKMYTVKDGLSLGKRC